MRFDMNTLPEGAVKVGETPVMNQDTVLPAILNKHMAPKGKYGYLVSLKGDVGFVWEDQPDDIIKCDPEHPVVIFPERYHHVKVLGDSDFKVEFYMIKNDIMGDLDQDAVRPGEAFTK